MDHVKMIAKEQIEKILDMKRTINMVEKVYELHGKNQVLMPAKICLLYTSAKCLIHKHSERGIYFEGLRRIIPVHRRPCRRVHCTFAAVLPAAQYFVPGSGIA